MFLVGCSTIPPVQKGQTLSEYLEAINFSGSVLVSRNNEIIHSSGHGFASKEKLIPNTPETQFYIASLTKQFTALAIMQLQEQKLLNINDSIINYLPDFPDGSEITIKHLLTYSAGLYDFTDEWANIKELDLSTQDIVDIFKQKPLDFEPGSKVRYSSSGYILAGLIIEKVSGMSYANYIESQIFYPLSMIRSSYRYSVNDSLSKAVGYKKGAPQQSVNMLIPYAAGSLTSSVTDLYLWDQSFYESTLVRRSSLEDIFQNDRSSLGTGFGEGNFKVVMGLGWGIYETKLGPEYSHTGGVDGFSAVISRYPKSKALIVILSNEDRVNVNKLKNRISELILTKEKT